MTKYEVKLQFEVDTEDGNLIVVYQDSGGQDLREDFSYAFDQYLLRNATKIKEHQKPVTYCVGDKFRDSDGDTCMAISAGEKRCAVVAIDAKNRSDLGFEYADVVSVSDQRHITQEELDAMAGPAYAPLTKIEDE